MKEKIKVAFQGEEGAYSHLACLEIFPKAEIKACATFDETFKPLIPVALIIIPLFLGSFYGVITLLLSYFKLEKNFSTIILFSIIFSFIEFIRSFIIGGFPWNIIAYSWTNYLYSLQILLYQD